MAHLLSAQNLLSRARGPLIPTSLKIPIFQFSAVDAEDKEEETQQIQRFRRLHSLHDKLIEKLSPELSTQTEPPLLFPSFPYAKQCVERKVNPFERQDTTLRAQILSKRSHLPVAKPSQPHANLLPSSAHIHSPAVSRPSLQADYIPPSPSSKTYSQESLHPFSPSSSDLSSSSTSTQITPTQAAHFFEVADRPYSSSSLAAHLAILVAKYGKDNPTCAAFVEVYQLGPPIPAEVYRGLLSWCAGFGRYPMLLLAEMILDEMTGGLSGAEEYVCRNVEVYNDLIAGYCARPTDVSFAQWLKGDMERRGIQANSKTYDALRLGSAKDHDWSSFDLLKDEMRYRNLAHTDSWHSTSCLALLTQGNTDAAERILLEGCSLNRDDQEGMLGARIGTGQGAGAGWNEACALLEWHAKQGHVQEVERLTREVTSATSVAPPSSASSSLVLAHLK